MPDLRPSAVVFVTILIAAALANGGLRASAPQPPPLPAAAPTVRPITWGEASATVDRFEAAMPQSLHDIPRSERPAKWPAWLASRRQELAARLAQGEVDSVVNLLLFGTSFTAEPRITTARLRELDRRWKSGDRSVEQALLRTYQQRAADLVAAAARPRADERMQEVRRVLALHGHSLGTASERRAAVDYLLVNVVRVVEEAAKLAADLEALRGAPDATARFAGRSRIFRDRGLAGDSSLLTQFAVDRALCGLRERAVLPARSLSRVAIVGPGLDFADKQEGFDFYRPQSLQPFTVMDSLFRCELAARSSLRVTTLDISPRVNAHLRAAASRGAYRFVLPWPTDAGWNDDVASYWRQAGDRIGVPFAVARGAATPLVRARGVAVAAEMVRRIQPLNASIVSDRLELRDDERFDLILASNVLLYYDTFEQSLALDSIAAMLRPGGVLLTNDAILEIPEIPMRAQGYLNVPFSHREGDGERMVWYVRQPGKE